ncbi:MAG: bifunctional [glutamate--ammonia ligase]-adenylyl-L-tyrosine phosphorylase/[glutamate--ammonia-ligase] adenylyltransferase [Burkholderiaceae bacterium]|jgi:glutamate-ammonia-ligase adenylyltransferase|nr:bifunctional [glutamate--ammonia ligase]-adenylyl-L-tyrosine phosphorylase/[glutamate--ammonia-ligase] adenylyltransferase [Burkholderiaceae bacterium]
MLPVTAIGSVSPDIPAPPSGAGADYSRFVQRIRRRYTRELALLPEGAPTRETMLACLTRLREPGQPGQNDVGAALRVLRQLVIERLATLDCEQGAPLEVVTHGMTWLAELALDVAAQQVFVELDARHGAPITDQGQRANWWIVGMGKLGGRELNVSSDIDLIYIHDRDGQTTGDAQGRGRISVEEYFTRAARRLYALIGEVTEHGFVFRVDLALRPNGNSGPVTCSLDALEEYLLEHGREWERFAWLKSRVVAPCAAIENGSAQQLGGVVLPFVFRRYLDYGVFEGLRQLHRQIREHAMRQSAGRPERANDVKLSRGGIREIEFTVQLLQVVRSGQFPELRTRATLQALPRLVSAGLMPPETGAALARAYVFLRRVEHRIQYLDDQQTHVLPTADADLTWIAATLGFQTSGAFLAELDAHRERVAQEFDALLGGGEPPACNKGCAKSRSDADGSASETQPNTAAPTLDSVLALFPSELRERLTDWRDQPRVQALRDQARTRLRLLMQRTGNWLREGRITPEAVLRQLDWMDTLLRRESYLALLLERPATHERLLHVLGAARWPARYLIRHPGVIDELAGPGLLEERFDAEALTRDLDARRAALARTSEDDEEELVNLLRRAHHAETFRTLVRDVEDRITVEQVADDLSALADTVLAVAARWCWSLLKRRHLDAPCLGIVAYGKLGGKELGYGSDLDLVFLFDDADDSAPEIYAAFVRKLITWLTLKTGEGDLYEIDTELRPNGNSGLLVTSVDAYADYQQQRGSNAAWTWEHQAMTRARCVLGNDAIRARFDAVRHAVITAPRDTAALRQEIIAMRERMCAAHPVKAGLFDLKHSPGGMVDAEFATQYLVLAHAARHPELEANAGNIALLQRAEAAGLLPAGVGEQAAAAYRALRRAQHKARLDEQPTQVAPEPLAAQREAILTLRRAVFG